MRVGIGWTFRIEKDEIILAKSEVQYLDQPSCIVVLEALLEAQRMNMQYMELRLDAKTMDAWL